MSARRVQRGFTLLELIVALALMALMSGVLYGSLGFAGRSWDAGEDKAEATSGMRLAHGFLRAQLEAQHPLRMRKIPGFPLVFTGTADELRYAAQLPARISGAGVWYYRLAVAKEGDRSLLVLERSIPDLNGADLPEFDGQDRSILAEGIAEIRIEYLGRDVGASTANEPTWRTHWDDGNRLPLMVRVDVIPERGAAWPTLVVAPRQAPEAGCRRWDESAQRCAGMT